MINYRGGFVQALIPAIIVLVVAGGGIAAWQLLGSAPVKSVIDDLAPEEVFVRAIEKASEQTSAAYSLTLEANGKNLGFLPEAALKLTSSGMAEMADATKGENKLNAELRFLGDRSQSFFPIPEKINLNFESRFIGEDVYFKASITGLPQEMLPEELPKYFNKWIRVNPDMVGGQGQVNFGDPEELEKSRKIFRTAVSNILRKYKVVAVSLIGTESVNGKSVNRYNVTLNKENLKSSAKNIINDFYMSLKDLAEEDPRFSESLPGNLPEEMTVSEADLAEFRRSVDSLNLPPIEFAIGREDNLIYRIAFATALSEIAGENIDLSLKITADFKDYGKPVNVSAPSPVIDFEELIESIDNGFSSPTPPVSGSSGSGNTSELLLQSADSSRIADIATLQSSISLYRSDVSGNFCTDSSVHTSNKGSRDINGSGWLPINFDQISTGSPLSRLPVDPINSSTAYYSYVCDPKTQTFELDTSLKSEKFKRYMQEDGGNNPNLYEVGSNLNLIK